MVGVTLLEGDFLLAKKTEIAILVENESIFSLTDSLDRLLEAYRFESRCFCETNKNASIEVYKDGHGNLLTIEYALGFMKETYDGREIVVSGISVNPIAELYIRSLRTVQKIDLRNYIRIYPENVFSEALKEIRKCLQIKARQAEEANKLMYV